MFSDSKNVKRSLINRSWSATDILEGEGEEEEKEEEEEEGEEEEEEEEGTQKFHMWPTITHRTQRTLIIPCVWGAGWLESERTDSMGET